MTTRAGQPPFDPYRILHELEQSRVWYILVGGLARVLQGADEVTRGVDLTPAIRDDNLTRLAEALVRLDAAPTNGARLARSASEPDRDPVVAFDSPSGEIKVVTEPAGTRVRRPPLQGKLAPHRGRPPAPRRLTGGLGPDARGPRPARARAQPRGDAAGRGTGSRPRARAVDDRVIDPAPAATPGGAGRLTGTRPGGNRSVHRNPPLHHPPPDPLQWRRILLGRRYRRTRHAAASQRGRPAAADDVERRLPAPLHFQFIPHSGPS
jgi:hypothetical protein